MSVTNLGEKKQCLRICNHCKFIEYTLAILMNEDLVVWLKKGIPLTCGST